MFMFMFIFGYLMNNKHYSRDIYFPGGGGEEYDFLGEIYTPALSPLYDLKGTSMFKSLQLFFFLGHPAYISVDYARG